MTAVDTPAFNRLRCPVIRRQQCGRCEALLKTTPWRSGQ